MRKIILLGFLFITALTFAQEDAWVYFTDKPNAQFYLDNPLEMLSQRALDRREAQNIPLDDKDVPVHQSYIDQIAATTGIVVKAKSKWLNALHIRGSVANINALAGLSFVEDIEFANKLLNAPGRPAGLPRPRSITQEQGTNADFSYGPSGSQIQMLKGHVLHQQDYTGTGKIIAVMDGGFPGVDTTQPFQNLITNNRILGGYNYVDGNDNFYTGGTHGTKVLSTLGGFVDGSLIGSAPDASYYLFITEDVTVENPVEESYWVEAAEVADSLGVDVINTSLGYLDYDNPAYNYTYEDIDGETAFITRGANVAFTRGMICVTSAGNSGNNAEPHIEVPADAFNTLTVGAVDFNEVRAGFSSIGPSFDGRIKPDVMAQGGPAVIANEVGSVTTGNGTSFSAPIMAGLVACLWQAFPDKTNSEILALVKGSADRFNNPNFEYGYGIPDFAWALNELQLNQINKQSFKVYPNPVKDNITIAFPDDVSSVSVTIFNGLGQVVLQKEISKNTTMISTEKLAAGIYNYRIETQQQWQTGKIVKE